MVESALKDTFEKMKDNVKKFTLKTDLFTQIIILFSLLIVFIIILSVIRLILLQNNLENCTDLDKLYSKKNSFISSCFDTNGNITNKNFSYQLVDYYIKSSYNSCCGGDPTNSFVSTCALKTCITQGYRFLDFEVYSVNNKPVISSSSQEDYRLKETYNYVEFKNAMKTISSTAFSSQCPNNKDPLILHFRLMTNKLNVIDEMANDIATELASFLLSSNYGHEYNGLNLGNVNFKDLYRKIIIMVDKSNSIFMSSKLDELVNLASNAIYCNSIRSNQLTVGNFTKNTVDHNRTKFTIVLPELSRSTNNYNPVDAFNQGCQFITMNMQNFDTNLEYYNKVFDENNYAFLLKPEILRGGPIVEHTTPVPDDSVKLCERTMTLPSIGTTTGPM